MQSLCLQFIRHTITARLIFLKLCIHPCTSISNGSISSNVKFLTVTAEALRSQALSSSILSHYSPAQNHPPDSPAIFSGPHVSLPCGAFIPPLCSGEVAALIWGLVHILPCVLTECVCDGMPCC